MLCLSCAHQGASKAVEDVFRLFGVRPNHRRWQAFVSSLPTKPDGVLLHASQMEPAPIFWDSEYYSASSVRRKGFGRGLSSEIHRVFDIQADARRASEALQVPIVGRYPGWASQRESGLAVIKS